MMVKIHKIIAVILSLGLLLTVFTSLSFGVSVRADANDAGYGGHYIGARYGEVDSHGESGIYGFTSDYVLWGGERSTQHEVKNGWHIVAYSYYDSHGVIWYECWDSDDGDYYGWIDGDYLYFYDSGYAPPAQQHTANDIYEVNPRQGEVYAPSGDVYGYTDGYVVYNYAQETQHKVQHTWHITAYNICYSHGVTWYECWDSDDGDYYGWIDEKFLRFYDEYPKTEPPTQATVATTEAVTTQATTTEATTTTEAETTTTLTTTTEEAVPAVAAIADEESDGGPFSGSMLIIIIIAAAIILLAIVAILLIVLLMRKQKSPQPVQTVQPMQEPVQQPVEQMPAYGYCQICGVPRTNPDSTFCEFCGSAFE